MYNVQRISRREQQHPNENAIVLYTCMLIYDILLHIGIYTKERDERLSSRQYKVEM